MGIWRVGIPSTGLTTPVGWLSLHQLTVLSRSEIVMLLKFFVAFFGVVTLLFGFFCRYSGFCHRTESDLILFLLGGSARLNSNVHQYKKQIRQAVAAIVFQCLKIFKIHLHIYNVKSHLQYNFLYYNISIDCTKCVSVEQMH